MDNHLFTQYNNKNCMVTGGAGFIGSNLSRYLNKIGAKVVIIDNFSTGRKENIIDFKDIGIDVLNLDITNTKKTEFCYKNIDFVFHHAAIASVPYSVKKPVLSRRHNVGGVQSVLKNSLVNGVTKIIFASSSAIYGDTNIVPTNENVETKPQSPYAEQKLEGELYCSNLNSNEIQATSLRYFNVFGPYQDPKSEYSAVIPKFIDSAIRGKDLIIYGDGKSTRDFVFVEDVIQANLISAISNNSDGEVINIATGQTISIGELAEMIIEITDSKSKIVHEKPRKGDILHSAADITKAKKILGYQPQTTLRDGLSITIDYFSKINNYD